MSNWKKRKGLVSTWHEIFNLLPGDQCKFAGCVQMNVLSLLVLVRVPVKHRSCQVYLQGEWDALLLLMLLLHIPPSQEDDDDYDHECMRDLAQAIIRWCRRLGAQLVYLLLLFTTVRTATGVSHGWVTMMATINVECCSFGRSKLIVSGSFRSVVKGRTRAEPKARQELVGSHERKSGSAFAWRLFCP